MLNRVIDIEIEGTKVKGRITYHDLAEITVEILEPYAGLSLSNHIPAIARPFKSHSGSAGELVAINLLTELYNECVKVERLKHVLAFTFQEVRNRTSNIVSIADNLSFRKKGLKKSLKAKDIDLKEYNQSLKKLTYFIKALKQKENIIREDFFKSYNLNSAVNGLTPYLEQAIPMESNRKNEYLNKHIFVDLKNLNDGFDVSNINYFSEEQFQIVLERVKEKGLGIYGIEPWMNGELFDVDTFESYDSFPQDPNWYFTSFEKFKKLGMNLQYSASYYVGGNF